MLVSQLRKLEIRYRSIRTPKNWRQLFLLQFLHANLNLLLDTSEVFAKDCAEQSILDFDTGRLSVLRQWSLKVMARNSNRHRRLEKVARMITENAQLLMDFMKAAEDTTTNNTSSPSQNEFSMLEAEVKACSASIHEILSRTLQDTDNCLRFQEMARNMRQSEEVRFLTILATIFLPLSLAAAILSMQTRLKDLGVLLYDFVGVGLILGTIALIIFLWLLLRDVVLETLTQFIKIRGRALREVRIASKIVNVTIITLFLALFLSSFLYGMLEDVQRGGLILGYGLAVVIGGPLMVLSAYIGYFVAGISFHLICCLLGYYSCKPERHRDTESESEA